MNLFIRYFSLSNLKSFTVSNSRATFADEQMCAGGEEGKDGCQGDSGGPFVHDRWDRPSFHDFVGVLSLK